MVMNLWGPWNVENVFTTWATVHHEVRYAWVNERMNIGIGTRSLLPAPTYYLQSTIPLRQQLKLLHSLLKQTRSTGGSGERQAGWRGATKQKGGGKCVLRWELTVQAVCYYEVMLRGAFYVKDQESCAGNTVCKITMKSKKYLYETIFYVTECP
jgi:hypothetical protein